LSQLATGAVLLFTFWAYSAPAGGYARWTRLAGAFWLLLGTLYVLRVLIAAISRGSIHFSQRGRWLVVPMLGVLALALVKTSAPFEARYWISRDAMDAAAQRVLATPREAARIHRIGLWQTTRVEAFRGGMRFLIDANGSDDQFGFAYSPSRRPPSVGGHDSYRHLDGPWYVWVTGLAAAGSAERSQASVIHTRGRPRRKAQPLRGSGRGQPATSAAARTTRAQVVAAARRAVRVHRVDLLAPAIGGGLHAMVAVVGRPDGRHSADTYCHARWLRLGLTVVLVSRSPRDACGRGRVVGASATGRQWRTSEGLRVGASLRDLRHRYPTSESVGYGWWRLPGIGRARSVPLHAHISRGHVDVLLLN